MSMGYGAKCRIIDSDENWIMYEYTSYDVDLEDGKKAMGTLDGIIIISKDFFPEPEVIRRRIRKPNGKKVWIEKKKYKDIDLEDFYNVGKIRIENSSHCWRVTENRIDAIALKLLFYLQIEYHEIGEIPEKFGIFS